MDKHKNRLFYGDCLNVLKELLEGEQPQYLDYGEGMAMPKKAAREKVKQNRNKLV